MKRIEKVELLSSYLNTIYPSTECFLSHKDEFSFLVAIILSAQAQDKVVNKVTPVLFERYPTILSLAKAKQEDVLNIIKIVGLGNSKSKNIIELADVIHYQYQDKIPHVRNILETLPGVGHKTAGVFLGEIDNQEVIPVDTHILRICYRLGISKKDIDPSKLEELLEKEYKHPNKINFHRQMILFGRNICIASSKRKCEECPLNFCRDRK